MWTIRWWGRFDGVLFLLNRQVREYNRADMGQSEEVTRKSLTIDTQMVSFNNGAGNKRKGHG